MTAQKHSMTESNSWGSPWGCHQGLGVVVIWGDTLEGGGTTVREDTWKGIVFYGGYLVILKYMSMALSIT